ncbi:hypothetical protein D3C87_1262930 [compost metagenome]
MRHPRVGGILGAGRRCSLIHQLVAEDFVQLALVMEVNRLAGEREKHRVGVCAPWLQDFDPVVAFADAVRAVGGVRAVERVDFLAQNRTAQCATGLAHFIG